MAVLLDSSANMMGEFRTSMCSKACTAGIHAEDLACWRAPLGGESGEAQGTQYPDQLCLMDGTQKQENEEREKTLLKEVPVEPGCVAVTHDCSLVWTNGEFSWLVSLMEGFVLIFTLRDCVEVLM